MQDSSDFKFLPAPCSGWKTFWYYPRRPTGYLADSLSDRTPDVNERAFLHSATKG